MTIRQKIALTIAVILASILGYRGLSGGGREGGERLYVNSVVMGFLSVKSAMEAELHVRNGTMDRDKATEIWRKSIGSIDGAREVFFEPKGQVVVISDRYGMAVLIEPTGNTAGNWHCSTYPRVSYESLCSRLNAQAQGR
jgi:hypothetical protein